MKERVFSMLALLLLSVVCYGAKSVAVGAGQSKGKGYRIEVKMTDMKDTDIYLAFYYNGKTYSKDTTHLDASGNGVFVGDSLLHQGMYIVYFKQDKFFDILVGKDQNIKLKADTTKLNPVVSAGYESMKFAELVKFMSDMREKREEAQKKFESKHDTAAFRAQLEKLGKEVEAYQKKVIEENKGLFFSDFVKGTIAVEVPSFEELPDTARPLARYLYTKEHYFDNVNLSDPRMLRTAYFPTSVDNYISKHILQIPDSLFQAADALIQKSKDNTETYQTMVSKMMNYGLKSNLMGMDRMWFQIAEKYYLSGEATWADTAWLKDLKDECKKVRYNQVGMKAKNINMVDKDNKPMPLRNLFQDKKNEFVLVYFFEPSCGHCKKITPVLHDSVYVKYKDKGFEVFCCYTQTNKEEWQEFLNKHNLHDWVNVWDPERQSYFWEFYDATVTPGIYLVDKEGKIVAKKISTESLDMILNEELVKRKEAKK